MRIERRVFCQTLICIIGCGNQGKVNLSISLCIFFDVPDSFFGFVAYILEM